MDQSMSAHFGPVPMSVDKGLTKDQRVHVYLATGCSASIRYRKQWKGKGLTIEGPPQSLSAAAALVHKILRGSIAVQKYGQSLSDELPKTSRKRLRVVVLARQERCGSARY